MCIYVHMCVCIYAHICTYVPTHTSLKTTPSSTAKITYTHTHTQTKHTPITYNYFIVQHQN